MRVELSEGPGLFGLCMGVLSFAELGKCDVCGADEDLDAWFAAMLS